MGQRLCSLAADQPDRFNLVAAIEHATHPRLGEPAVPDAPGSPLHLSDELAVQPDVLIDFSLPVATAGVIELCRDRGIPLVLGTTGLTDDHHQQLDDAAARIPVCQSSNFSLVVNVLWKLAADAARLLGEDYDIEVLETHHRDKKDAPSGTARTLAQQIVEAVPDRGLQVRHTRDGEHDPRKPEDLTIQTLRLGDHPGEHTAYFAAPGERLELRHVSTTRDSYAAGALQAATWLADQPAGRYDMADVLGL
jgi:4-hydroxy-tetrahydrodipicolinate reductase